MDDFVRFLRRRRGSRQIAFNGVPAQPLHRRHVLAWLPQPLQTIPRLRLPATCSARTDPEAAAEIGA